ncbi:MAG: extracellular solute-binding protein [Thermomicrobiales bacterium]|nr:extracellular solute-binding protein [Thermomicrobiales bacterium]MCO5226159.1 extracellular solute-binding protein [Thermomicrobiales bacterium]
MTTFKTTRRRLVGTGIAGAALVGAAKSTAFAAPLLKMQDGVTLEVWGGVPAENGPQALVDAFTEASGIKVNYTRYVNDDTGNTQLDTALQGSTTVDAFFTYQVARLAQRINAGAALDISEKIAGDEQISAWVAETDGIFTIEDGVYHSLPTTQEMQFMFINQKIFEDAGIDVPTAGWTLDDYVGLAGELSDGMTFGTYAPMNTATLTIGQNAWYNEDGSASNFGDPLFAEHYGRHRQMVDDGIAFPWTDVIAQNLRAYAQTPFLTEQVAMWVNSPWSLRYVNDKEQYPHDFVTTFAPLPSFADGQYNNQGINNWMLGGASTQYPDEVWELIKFWLTDGAVYMLPAGKIPALMTLDQATVVDGMLGPNADELYDKAAFEAAAFDPDIRYYTDSITTGAAEISTLLSGLEDRLLIGELDVDQFISELTEGADGIIAAAQ